MLSRQRRFISDMFSYFTGDSGDSKTEPEPENIHYPQPESAHEPSYPVKPNQHRHYRSPHPEPEPEGILVAFAFSECLFNFLFIMKVPILLCYMKVPGRWAMTATSPKMMRAVKTKLSIIIIREAAWTSYPRRNLSSTWSPDWTEKPRPAVLTCSVFSDHRDDVLPTDFVIIDQPRPDCQHPSQSQARRRGDQRGGSLPRCCREPGFLPGHSL